MRAVEPAGPCCCPCSGLCRGVCSPGATCSSKEELPPPSLWSWPETSYWNVRYCAILPVFRVRFCTQLGADQSHGGSPIDERMSGWTLSRRYVLTKSVIWTDVDQFLGSIKGILGSLLERFTGAAITDKLGSSILATVFRQLVIHSCLVILNCPAAQTKSWLYWM